MSGPSLRGWGLDSIQAVKKPTVESSREVKGCFGREDYLCEDGRNGRLGMGGRRGNRERGIEKVVKNNAVGGKVRP